MSDTFFVREHEIPVGRLGHTGKAVVEAITLDYSASADVERSCSDSVGNLEPVARLPGRDVMNVAEKWEDRVAVEQGRSAARHRPGSQ